MPGSRYTQFHGKSTTPKQRALDKKALEKLMKSMPSTKTTNFFEMRAKNQKTAYKPKEIHTGTIGRTRRGAKRQTKAAEQGLGGTSATQAEQGLGGTSVTQAAERELVGTSATQAEQAVDATDEIQKNFAKIMLREGVYLGKRNQEEEEW